MDSASPLDALASFACGLGFDDIPAPTVAKARIHILDTLGAALAGTRSLEFATIVGLLGPGSPGGAVVWGTGLRSSARDAALANGVSAHVFELDDTGGCDHSGAVVLPAVFAVLDSEPVSGRELIAATVVGYEVGRRVLEAAGGYDTHNKAGWHSTGTCGAIGAAAAVARLKNFSAARMRDAITLATSFSSGLWAFIHDGAQTKKIHAGRAAEGGVLAAQLAGAGFRGPARVFNDVWGGFFRSLNHAPGDLRCFTEDLGKVWKLDRVSLKPYASCRGVHSAVDALGDILDETGRRPGAIASISVRLSEMLMGMCGQAETKQLTSAQMSLPYALAARCVFEDAGLGAYAEDCRRDARLARMIERISLQVDATLAPLDEPIVEIRFEDGTTIERMVPRPSGSPQRPMTEAAIFHKFETLAGMALASEDVRGLRAVVLTLDALPDCREVAAAMARTAPPAPIFR